MKRYLQIVLVLSLFFFITTLSNVYAYEEEIVEASDILKENEVLEASNISAGEPKIYSKVAIVYDRKYKRILYEKNIDEKVPNASTTKILTAIVAYENSNKDDIVTAGRRAALIGGSRIGLKSGDKITMDHLMKGLLISSGNDAAIAIAEHVGGSVENFCDMMNKKARELGALNTHFVTPHGLDNDEHYTTASDLLILANYFMDIDYLREIVDLSNAEIKISDRTKSLRTTNEMHSIYPEVNGLKTGFTNKAGRCLATSIYKNDRELISIVLGADTKRQRTIDTISLINYGYAAFEVVDLFEGMDKTFEIIVDKSLNRKYQIIFEGSKEFVLRPSEINQIKYEYNIVRKHTAPLKAGESIGKIDVFLGEELLTSVNLISNYNIERKGIKEYFCEILEEKLKYIEIEYLK